MICLRMYVALYSGKGPILLSRSSRDPSSQYSIAMNTDSEALKLSINLMMFGLSLSDFMILIYERRSLLQVGWSSNCLGTALMATVSPVF